MAKRVRHLGNPGKAGWAHDWYTYEGYLTVHYQYMSALSKAGKIVRESLSFLETRDEHDELLLVHVRGRIECDGGILVRVSKYLDVRRNHDNRYEVKGQQYIYQAWSRGTRRSLLRYDQSHGGLHRHCLDPVTGELVGNPITLDELPTLAGFIEESLSVAQALA